MRRDSVLSLVGIAKKAGKIAAGEFQTENAVKSGKASLVIISSEASANTKKKFRNMCTFYEVPVYFYGGKEELGAAIGCEFRASLAVTDQGLSGSIEKQLRRCCEAEGVKEQEMTADSTDSPDSIRDGGYEYGKNQGA